MLYEVLTGRRAFPGITISDCLAAVLSREPDWSALPEATPPHVRGLPRRCLQKDRNQRLRDMGDARLELEEPPVAPTPAFAAPVHRRRPALLAAACVVVGASAAAVLGWQLWRQRPAAPPVARFAITLPANETLAFDHSSAVVISPDGARLAYVATRAASGSFTCAGWISSKPSRSPGRKASATRSSHPDRKSVV